MSNIYFMCENCGIETNGITFVNGMKFCAKCYHQIFGKDNQQIEINQLKQQLAEKEKKIEFIKHLGNHKTTTEMFKENAKLIIEKRQLAIRELEKVKTLIQNAINFEKPNFVGVYDAINKQIKELKGEKDVED